MGTYLRSKWYWYKRTIDKLPYYRPLKIKKGQENLMSERIAQADEEIVATHFGLRAPGTNRDILFSEFLPVYEKRKAGKGSLDKDLQRLRASMKAIGDKRLGNYTLDNFQDFEKALLKGHAPSTVNRYIQALHHFFEIAIRERAVFKNPLEGFEYFVESASGRRALSDDEIRALLAALRVAHDQAVKGKRYLPVHEVLLDVVLFGLYTGARLNEIVQLRRSDIHGDVVRLKISQVKYRRRGRQAPHKEKPIYLPAEALEIIERQPAQAGDDHVFFFRWRDRRAITKAIWQLAKTNALGVPGFTFHWLRHTWITRASELTDTPTLRDMVAHSDMRTTLNYTHADEPKKKAVASKMGTIIRAVVASD